MRILLDTGLRRSEMAAITMSDVDLGQQTLRVIGKGGRVRGVPYGRKAARDLDRYLRVRQQKPHGASPKLWIGKSGPATPNGIYQVMRTGQYRPGWVTFTHTCCATPSLTCGCPVKALRAI